MKRTLDVESEGGSSGISVTATFNGWTHVKAVGAKAPAAQGSDLATSVASVTLTWEAASLSEGAIDSYNIYRSTVSGAETFSIPLQTGIDPNTRTYIDSTVVGGTTYYYNVAPVTSGTAVVPDMIADREIKVIAPPANMALVHRWIANQLMCGEMGLAVDRTNQYRCAFTGIGGTGTHFDVGHSIFVDTYELGCNYTATPGACGTANGCIDIDGNPNGDFTSALGDIYYSRRDGRCWVNTNGAFAWTTLDTGTNANIDAGSSHAPGLPPLQASQAFGDTVCHLKSVAGFAGTKRLLRRQEFVIAAAWDASLSDASIDTIESGVNLHTTNHCNSNHADPQGTTTTDISGTAPAIAYDNTAYPAAVNRDTLPFCLHGDCASTAFYARLVRTGSNVTQACVSRFGIQDMVGNIGEYNSDQITNNGATGSGIASSYDSNDDWMGVDFDGTQGPTIAIATPFTGYTGKIEFPHAIPIDGAAYTAAGVVDWSGTPAKFHSDAFWINTGDVGTWAARSGGEYDKGSAAGRFSLHLRAATTIANENTGARCAFEAD